MPEIAVTVSVAVTVWVPAVFSVTGNVPTPFVNVEFVGNVGLAVAARKVDAP